MPPLRCPCPAFRHRDISFSLWSHTSRTIICRRSVLLSTSAPTRNDGHFPFPENRNPSPHQIFHLPINATEEDIKARYYDLVRIHHPDKAGQSLPPEVAHTRFQAITAAYELLRRKQGGAENASAGWKEGGYPTTAAWRAASQARRAQELYSGKTIDDRWKDRIFMLSIIMAVGAFVFQTVSTRREAMGEVVSRSRHAVHDRKQIIPENSNSARKQDAERLSA